MCSMPSVRAQSIKGQGSASRLSLSMRSMRSMRGGLFPQSRARAKVIIVCHGLGLVVHIPSGCVAERNIS